MSFQIHQWQLNDATIQYHFLAGVRASFAALGCGVLGPQDLEIMEYKQAWCSTRSLKIKPRLIIHGGAGNIKPTNLTPERYQAVRTSLLGMVCES